MNLDKNKTVYVHPETYAKIVWGLGYKPENLVVNQFVSKENALVVDNKYLVKGVE